MSSNNNNNNNNNNKPMPNLPLPKAICSDVPGTWAYDTMSRRVDAEILQRTYDENKESFARDEFATALERFLQLRRELQSASTTKLTHLSSSSTSSTGGGGGTKKEQEEWKEILTPLVEKGDTWLSAPWMVTEFYVYRRLMDAIGYWDESNPATYKYDVFANQKRAGLHSSVAMAEAALGKLPTLPSNTVEGLSVATAFALWGNKMDLSLWPAATNNNNDNAAEATSRVFADILASAKSNLLHDDTDILWEHCKTLQEKGGGMVDIIVDNAGFELVMDLALAQFLVQSGIAKVVTFQLKSHPTFVSDALEQDLRETVDYYASMDPAIFPNAHAAGITWQSMLNNSWQCHQDPFWVQPYAMWDMTEPLRTDMNERCELAFCKGDANYRRLLGDLMWHASNDSFQNVVGSYFPCPVCALRTLKAQVGCGMKAEKVERAKQLDPNWMVNGRFGVVHYGTGVKKEEST